MPGYTLRRDPLTMDGSTQWMGWFPTHDEAHEFLVEWEVKNEMEGLSGWRVVPEAEKYA